MRTTLIILVLILPWLSSGQEITNNSFSLDEAIAYALEHNYSALNATRDLDDAQKQK